MKSASSSTCTLTRLAILGVTGVAALSVAACRTSHEATNTPAPATTSPSPAAAPPAATTPATTPPPAAAEGRVKGLISSVSGNTVELTNEKKGNATVSFTPSTQVSEVTKAALSDVTAGSCVLVRPTKEEAPAGQPITAAVVRVSQAVDGKCAPEPGPAEAGKRPPVQGAVASVSGKTINVTIADPTGGTSQTAVTVDDKTKYRKQNASTSQAIVQGKCLAAQGAKDSGGTVQATTIRLWQPVDGKCGHDKEKEQQPQGH